MTAISLHKMGYSETCPDYNLRQLPRPEVCLAVKQAPPSWPAFGLDAIHRDSPVFGREPRKIRNNEEEIITDYQQKWSE